MRIFYNRITVVPAARITYISALLRLRKRALHNPLGIMFQCVCRESAKLQKQAGIFSRPRMIHTSFSNHGIRRCYSNRLLVIVRLHTAGWDFMPTVRSTAYFASGAQQLSPWLAYS